MQNRRYPLETLKNFRKTTEHQNFEQFHNGEKSERETHAFNMHSVAKYQKMEGGPFATLKSFRKSPTKSKKGDSHSAEESGKAGAFCFGMVLYFM